MHHPLLQSADLDHPLGTGPAVYRDLVEALDALLKGEPDHPDLLGKLDEMRVDGENEPRLPVNIENVTVQARRNRKAIVGRRPRYPKLARLIREIRPSLGVSETTTNLIKRLQHEAREWRQRERVLRSRLAEQALRLADAQRDLVEAQREAARWRRKAG